MNYISDINLKNENNSFNAIVEIPKGTNKKFELVEPTNEKVECVRKVKGKYPFYYGCFPQTLADDKDPLDMILLSNKKYNSLDIVEVTPIALIKTIDNGEIDNKIICLPKSEIFEDLFKLENKALKFLSKYKGKKSDTKLDKHIYGMNEAEKEISLCNDRYVNKNRKKISKNTNNNLKSF